jgi:small subunit ribosomal protein S4
MWGSPKDPYNKKNYPPGVHGPKGYRRLTEFGIQLLAKQKLRLYYGSIREAQFKTTFEKAKKIKGDTGENFVGLLESRLDCFVYRAKFASTIFAARQFVSHKHILVNGRDVNIPSYILKPHDIVKVRDDSQNIKLISKAKQQEREVPQYIHIRENNSAMYLRVPCLSEIPYPIKMDPNYIVEYYSR